MTGFLSKRAYRSGIADGAKFIAREMPFAAAGFALRGGLDCQSALIMFDAIGTATLGLLDKAAQHFGTDIVIDPKTFTLPDWPTLAAQAGETLALDQWTAESARRLQFPNSFTRLLMEAHDGK